MALTILFLAGAWQGWLSYQALAKIPQALADLNSGEPVDLFVTLRFPPERFHILMFQKFGRVSGTEGHSVEVRSVRRSSVRRIARFYWVKEIALLEGDREGP
jgi:hypothetical protein